VLNLRSALVALAILAGATAPVLTPASASAAEACDGVTVVVEPNALGGEPEVACVPPAEGDTDSQTETEKE